MHTLRIRASFPARLLPSMKILSSDGDSLGDVFSTSLIAVRDMPKVIIEMTHGWRFGVPRCSV